MTAVTLRPSAISVWEPKRSRAFIVAVHVPFLAVAPTITIVGYSARPRPAWLVLPLPLAVGALQLRHSLAAARGARPNLWPVTFAALGGLVFVPLPWFGVEWASLQWMFMASAAMLVPGRLGWLAGCIPLIVTAVWNAIDTAM